MPTQRPFQKLLLAIAILSYLAAAACGVGVIFFKDSLSDPVAASLMASIVFFIGVGVVLQVIGTVNLPDLRVGR
ncbi:MAG: hemerythrin family protein [Gammaproteobacteria bacterium]|nr:hemerythrin family protein [Gammaproteobacteria bacterium]MBU1654455.1 hemerythrin family protein [Gammaproteobacteria bacterium]MBU1962613.1 hemerythrin family protein [Gammaproteobacteria bacterium]